MSRKIFAITLIFVCTSFAWVVLGSTIFARTYDSDLSSANKVTSTWGAPQNQGPPIAKFITQVPKEGSAVENGQLVKKSWTEDVVTDLPLESSRIDVDLDLEHRQKGLLWYSTYKVHFGGVYIFRNTSDKDQYVTFALQFPTPQAIYDDPTFTVDGNPVTVSNEKNVAKASVNLGAGKTAQLQVGYKSQGL